MNKLLIHLPVFAAIVLGVSSCIGLKPMPDTTKTFALGLSDLPQNDSVRVLKKGYIVRPKFPVYMEGRGLKILTKDGEIVNFPEVRWAEPIDVGVARAMSNYIEILGDGIKSDFYPWVHDDDAAFTLEISFKQLIATEKGRILLYADWEYKEGNNAVNTGSFISDTATWLPDNAQSMVAGINSALKVLTKEILDIIKK